jgi:hypothetical protein
LQIAGVALTLALGRRGEEAPSSALHGASHAG